MNADDWVDDLWPDDGLLQDSPVAAKCRAANCTAPQTFFSVVAKISHDSQRQDKTSLESLSTIDSTTHPKYRQDTRNLVTTWRHYDPSKTRSKRFILVNSQSREHMAQSKRKKRTSIPRPRTQRRRPWRRSSQCPRGQPCLKSRIIFLYVAPIGIV